MRSWVLVLLAAPAACAGRPASFGPPPGAEGCGWVDDAVPRLPLEQRLGQMVVTRVGAELPSLASPEYSEVARLVARGSVGGLALYGGEPRDVAAFTNALQGLARLPLFFAADYENGLRMRLRGGTPFTSNMGVAAAGDPQAAYVQGRVTAEEMRAIGVHWLFAPVADVNNNPDNPVINTRSFGEDPGRVAAFVAAAVRGIAAGGALATAKHFPGHGDTAVDSHLGLPVLRVDRARLDAVELPPFRAAIAAGVGAVMTAHVALPVLTGDDAPATLSPSILTGLLRGELGFTGIIATDSLRMDAITARFGAGEAAVRAVAAGADVALSPPDPEAAVAALAAAVRAGRISEAQIDASVRRIVRAKCRLGLFAERSVDVARVAARLETPEAVGNAQGVAERSITLVRNDGGLVPLSAARAARALFVVLAADDDPREGSAWTLEVERRVAGARVWRLDVQAGPAEHEALVGGAAVAAAEEVVVAAFVKRAPGKGTVALPGALADLVRRLAETRPVVVIAFGSPYLLRQFPEVPAYVAAFAVEEVAQRAAARVVFGELPLQGTLPVVIPTAAPAGDGATE